MNKSALRRFPTVLFALLVLLMIPVAAFANPLSPDYPMVFGIPVDFILFALILVGIALNHHHTFNIAVTGVSIIIGYKLLFTGFATGPGIDGFVVHLGHEWVTLTNLLALLLGFVILARHFEKSHVPVMLSNYLPDNWTGGFLLLVMIFVISSFLDNIAAALIGGAMAHQLFRARVHIGFLAAIVAASNAGGSGSVLGDTTTTMMWIDGIDPRDVLNAYVAAGIALLIFGIPAAILQQRYSPIIKHAHAHTHVDWHRVSIVAFILLMAMGVNIGINLNYPEAASHFPFIGVAVWVAIVLSMGVRRHDWEEMVDSIKGTVFLLCLVLAASLMPVERLPIASWETAFGMGFVSAVFDNIPLTALALRQGGYDWGVLAYAVGFGGSMVWFGSSAGVALTNMFPEGKSVGLWLRHGWYVVVGYVAGFMVMLWLVGWHPHAPHKPVPFAPASQTLQVAPAH